MRKKNQVHRQQWFSKGHVASSHQSQEGHISLLSPVPSVSVYEVLLTSYTVVKIWFAEKSERMIVASSP